MNDKIILGMICVSSACFTVAGLLMVAKKRGVI